MTDKTKVELIVELRRRIAELEASEAERKRAEELLAGQREILEMVATGCTIQETLDAITTMIEGLAPGTLCSILLLDEAGQHLSHGSAPSLPKEYVQAVDGLAIGPCAGSCGTAAYRVETVIVEDTELDPLWADYRDPARTYGLRACWSVPIRDSSGRVLGTFALYDHQPRRPSDQDVRLVETAAHLAGIALERSRAEAALQFAQFAIDRAGDAAFWLDSQARFFYVNDAACRSLGYSREEFLSMTVHDIDSWFPAVTWEEHWREIKQRRSLTFESRHRTKDGRIFPVEINANYLDFNGKEYHCTFARDITERKRAEGELTEARAQLQYILASSSAIIYTTQVSDDPACTFVSENIHAILGYTPQEMTADPKFWPTHLHPEDAPRVFKEVFPLIERGGGTIEYRFQHREGHYLWFQDTFKVIQDEAGRPLEIVGSWADITERKRAETALQKSEERFNLAISGASDGLWDRDILTGEEWWSPRFYELLGYEEGEIEVTCTKFQELLHPEDEFEALEAVRAHLEDRIGYDVEIRLLTKSGEYRWFRSRGQALWDEAGKPVRMAGSIQDITKRKGAEAALHRVSRQNKLILNSAGEGIFGLDLQGNTTFVNPAAAEMIGWEAEELMGQSMHAVLHHSQPDGTPYPAEECPIYAGFKDGAVRQVNNEVFWRKDGTSFPVEYTSTPIRDERGELVGAVVTFKDITERKKADQQIIDYQGRLRALTLEVALAEERERRRIATGLHDDIGQILATAKLKLGELQQSEPSGEGSRLLQEIRDLIDKTIRDSRSLTFELSSPILYTLGLEAALVHLGKQLERRDGIRCHFETDNQPKPLGNEASVVLYRTVRELVHNVEKHAHARQVKMAVARVGDQIHISVEDDGVGFDASRIGQSVMWTGRFGLFSICEQLKQLGGRLEGESVPGQGTRIVVVAPLQ